MNYVWSASRIHYILYYILQVEADDKYERIGGTSMGGGTFWGLGSLLTKARGFDELLQLASEGDHRNVDLLVKDIYGKDGNAVMSVICSHLLNRYQSRYNIHLLSMNTSRVSASTKGTSF